MHQSGLLQTLHQHRELLGFVKDVYRFDLVGTNTLMLTQYAFQYDSSCP